MLVLIAQIVLISCLIGMGTLLFRKIPLLTELPDSPEEGEGFLLSLKNKIKTPAFLESFSYELFLQKVLSRIKILSLKTENRVDGLLQKLRQNSKKKRVKENDNYWEQLKKPSVSSLRLLPKKGSSKDKELQE